MMRNKKKVLLSFDVEEFDMPFEYGGNPSMSKQIATSKAGLNKILAVLNDFQAKATFYTTATYALAEPEQIAMVAQTHEIASHNYYHSKFEIEDLANSKKTLESISNTAVVGFRMPRMAPVSNTDLLAAGYLYNASVNPCWLPGRYDMRHISRNVYSEDNLLQFPASVSPKYRVPLFWIAFHNFPLIYFFYLCKKVLEKDGYLHLYFHPWEFTDYTLAKDGAKYPFYLHRNNGEKMKNRFEKLMKFLQNEGCEFETTGAFLSSIK